MFSMLDRLLDATIFLSFDRSGYKRHQRRFQPDDLKVDLRSKRILVTGANSGLGRSAAHSLAGLGAEVWLLCRSQERGQIALDDIYEATGNNRAQLEIVDMSSLGSIQDFVERLGDLPVDGLIHNAGVLPTERVETADGLELSWATNVVGPFLMTALLLGNLRRAPAARVINISSGGMYTQRLDLRDPQWHRRPFDGVKAYAQTKRAEVILTEQWAERLAADGVVVNSMHPGWADTRSVRETLPRFHRFTQKRLRDPRQGADTIIWLAACERIGQETGKLFFDRRAVSTHFLPGTRESSADREALWQLCCQQAGISDPV